MFLEQIVLTSAAVSDTASLVLMTDFVTPPASVSLVSQACQEQILAG